MTLYSVQGVVKVHITAVASIGDGGQTEIVAAGLQKCYQDIQIVFDSVKVGIVKVA
jgi:hypothetical protein